MKKLFTKGRIALLVIFSVLIIDQIIKVWIKTHMYWHESIRVTDWFYIYFTENNGMAFGMEILAYDPYMPKEAVEATGAEYVDLDTMLSQSDIVSIHLPVLPSTKAIVNKDWFSKMKPTAYVINTARAAVIDQKDFVEALENKVIGGAAVDVYWQEPVPANHPLLKMRNVTCTPHYAGLTTDVDNWSGRIMSENIMAYLKGEPAKHIWKVKK